MTSILHEEVKKPGVAMEHTSFRDLLPVHHRSVVDLLIKQKEWPVLKEFICAESQEVQQAFEVFMKSVDKSGAIVDSEHNDVLPVPRKRFKSSDQASIRSPQLPSEETVAVESLQLKVVNEKVDAKEEDTKDDSKFTISDTADFHIAVRQGDEKLAQSLIDKGVDINGKEGPVQSDDDSVDAPVSIFRLEENVSDLHYLNQGREGSVFTAKVTDLGKACVKIFTKFDEYSRKEAEKLLSLRGKHLNVVQVFGTYEGFNPYIPASRHQGYVMEFMDGGTLEEAIYSDHPYEPAQAYFWMLQIVYGVVYLHMKDIAHLDLKPSKRASYMYMAPELFAENDADTLDLRKCDIYSIGITFWEILYRQYVFILKMVKCPRSPFDKDWTVAVLCDKVTEGVRPCLDNFIWDSEIQEVLEMSWQEYPSFRYLMDFVVALEQAMENIPDNPFSTQRLYTLYWNTKKEYFLNILLVYLMTMDETIRAFDHELESSDWHATLQKWYTFIDDSVFSRSYNSGRDGYFETSSHLNGTPVHFAAQKGQVDMVKLFLQHKATIGSEYDHITPLHLAALRGDNLMVKMFVKAGASVSSKDKYGCTPLHFAARYNHIESAKMLLKHCAPMNVTTLVGTPLHFAVQKGHVDMVKLLLQHEAIVDSKDNHHVTPLHLAALQGDNLIMEMLITAGASVSSKGKDGWTPLHCAAEKGHVDTVKLLLQKGAIVDSADNKHVTPLLIATRKKCDQLVNVLLDAGASVSSKDIYGKTPLHSAVLFDRIENVRALLKHRAPIDTATVIGRTPLHLAAQNWHDHIVDVLLMAGASVSSKDKDGRTALHLAAEYGHVKMVKLLLQHGAIVDSEDNDHNTPLHLAAQKDQVVDVLLMAGASVSSKNKDGLTPLHFAAERNHIESAITLLKYCAPIDTATLIGRTILHFAAHKDHVDMVKLLLQHGAVVDSCDNDLYTPLHFAAYGGYDQVVDVLLSAGATITSKNIKWWTPLHCAAYGGHELVVKLLLDENADPNACDCNGSTPLHVACSKDMIKVVELLLQYKAPIEVTDKDGRSPLHIACLTGAINCVTYLLERGANANTTANDGSTALYNAADANHADVVKILIQYGANVDVRCINFQTALRTASYKGNVDIVTFLLQTGANPNSAIMDNETLLQFARANGHNEVAAIPVEYGARPTRIQKRKLN